MTWTYTSTDPGATDRDKVRFRIGDDLSTAVPTLTDEEIAYALTTHSSNILKASVMCLRSLVRRAAKYADFETTGDLKVWASQRHESLKSSLAELEAEADLDAVGTAAPYVAGDLKDDDDDLDTDTDRNQPFFRRGRMDNNENPVYEDETY